MALVIVHALHIDYSERNDDRATPDNLIIGTTANVERSESWRLSWQRDKLRMLERQRSSQIY
jgi:hypothetical protein